MTNCLHYPHTAHKFSDVARQSTCLSPEEEHGYLQALMATNNTTNPERVYSCHSPIMLPGKHNLQSAGINDMFGMGINEHKTLSSISRQYGGAITMSLAQLVDDARLNDNMANLNTFGGNGMGAAASSSSMVLRKIDAYDKALSQYERFRNHRAAPDTLNRLQKQAEKAFKDMNGTLNSKNNQLLHNNVFKQRQVLNQTGRVVQESIPISSVADAQKLSKFAKSARMLGPGIILLDGGLRANKVRIMKNQNDPKWKREAVVQGVAFGAGIVAGAVIGVLLAPAAGGILLTIAIGGVAALAIDAAVQYIVGGVYDLANK